MPDGRYFSAGECDLELMQNTPLNFALPRNVAGSAIAV